MKPEYIVSYSWDCNVLRAEPTNPKHQTLFHPLTYGGRNLKPHELEDVTNSVWGPKAVFAFYLGKGEGYLPPKRNKRVN